MCNLTWTDFIVYHTSFVWMMQLNSGKVVAVGPGHHDREGKLIPVSVKEGDTVLLPEYGGTEVKLDDKEYVYSCLNFILSSYITCEDMTPSKLHTAC